MAMSSAIRWRSGVMTKLRCEIEWDAVLVGSQI